jgi:predicted glycogen debranching enzyme
VPAAASRAIGQFIVSRDECLTVLAGFPWFLDWGRDTMICLRGIIADGRLAAARKIVLEFARFEEEGTLPNVIRGGDVSNRDTSDAPLWFFAAVGDLLAAERSDALLQLDCAGRSLRQILHSIADNYIRGTPNGIAMDAASGLVFSPMHFTWMDTNHPAGTPRQGYPIEIQALWHAALSLLARIDPGPRWTELAGLVRQSIARLYVRPGQPYLSDCLHAEHGLKASDARADDALRPNQLLAISLGAVTDPALCRDVLAACQELLVPGAIRTLADRPVATPMPVVRNGSMLNDPYRPYWGQYHGDEDTRRKPAYHNGTAWTWIFPSYCEAIHLVYGATARDRALAILSSATELFSRGCIGHVPEIVDGDAPHEQRGCGAQAWGATELLRVWKLLA